MVKRTYQPNSRRRAKTHGFLSKMRTLGGINVLKRRRAKGRARLAVWSNDMLKREFKLKNSTEIKEILKLGQKSRGEFLTLFTRAGLFNYCRAAVIVGGKVASSAVMRNRIRRLIFTDLETRLAVWENRPVNDMVVMVNIIPNDEKQLLIDLNRCFARL